MSFTYLETGINVLCKLSATCVRNHETRVHVTDELRQCLLHVQHGLEQSLIDKGVDQYRQHACVLVFVPVADTFEHTFILPCDYRFFSLGLYLMNLMLHITLDAENHRLIVHYKCEMRLFHFYKVQRNYIIQVRWIYFL